MLADSKSHEQQNIRGSGIFDIKSNGCSHGPDSLVDVDIAKGEGRNASKT